MVFHSLLQWTTFCQTSPPWPIHLGWPHMAWLSFIELDKAVVHVIRLASCLWLWFQPVCPLMPSLSLVGISLTLNVDYLFMAAPTKCSRAPLRGHGVSPLGRRPWPWTWDSSSRPPLLTLDVVYLQRSRSCSSLLEHPRCFTTLLLFIKYNSTISELYVISTFWFIYI